MDNEDYFIKVAYGYSLPLMFRGGRVIGSPSVCVTSGMLVNLSVPVSLPVKWGQPPVSVHDRQSLQPQFLASWQGTWFQCRKETN